MMPSRADTRKRPHRLLLPGLLLLWACQAAAVTSLSVIGLFKDKAVVVIDGRQRVMSAGQTSPEGVKLVSADSRQAVLEVNGVRHTYTLSASGGGTAPTRGRGTAVTIAPDSQGMYEISGSINGSPVNFVVDTGSTMVTMNGNEARKLGLNYKADGKKSAFSTATGIDIIYIVNLNRVRVGGIELRDVACSVHEGDFPTSVLLGNSFLNRVALERQGQLLRLKPLYSGNTP